MDFIPAWKSNVFTNIFNPYVKWLFWRRFKAIWIHQEYQPGPKDRTVYMLNHTSWWDGLIPLLLNSYRFHQNAYAMMEHKQTERYPFFKWLGAFSIQVEEPALVLTSLRYALNVMQQPHASLYIYPEGEIRPAKQSVHFETGIGWLYQHLPDVNFVPVGIHQHTIRHDKPELHLWVDKSIQINRDKSRQELTDHFEAEMNTILESLLTTSGFDDSPYGQFL